MNEEDEILDVIEDEDEEKGTAATGADEVKTFTQEDVDQLIKDRMKREQTKWDKKLSAQVDQKLNESKRLSELSDDERASEAFTQREKDIEARENKLKRQELLGDTEQSLRTLKLPATFAPFLIGDDEETTLTSINAFKVAFAEAVKAEVKNELSGRTPDKTTVNDKVWTRAEIAKVKDPAKRLALIKEHDDLYKK